SGERRVALIPDTLTLLKKAGHEAIIAAGAGTQAGYADQAYRDKGAEVIADRAGVFAAADVILQIRGLGANKTAGQADVEMMKPDQIIIAMVDPLDREAMEALREVAPDLKIKPIHCTGNDFMQAFRQLFPDSAPTEPSQEMSLEGFDLPAGGLKSKKAAPKKDLTVTPVDFVEATPVTPQHDNPQYAATSANPQAAIANLTQNSPQLQEISEILTRIAHSIDAGSTNSQPPSFPILDLNAAPLPEHYTLDNFAAGDENGATLNLLKRFAKDQTDPGQLLLIAPPGNGKTHLAAGFAKALRNERSNARIAYLSCHAWAQGQVAHTQAAQTHPSETHPGHWDALIIDDIHALAENRPAQIALMAILSSLQDRDKPTIITSTEPIDGLKNFEPQLLSRLHGGTTATIAPADESARVEIAAQFCARKKLQVPDDVIRLVAEAITGDLRKLFGAMLHVAAEAEIREAPMSLELAREVLNSMGDTPSSR
ncbi:MAG: ATP-binding protein, partial [Proteobacteria bacterium]|nr:ATP-binding protein [Pseudomonadota bacterium]